MDDAVHRITHRGAEAFSVRDVVGAAAGDRADVLDREGEIGLLLETELMTERSGYPDAEFSRVMWKDGKVDFCKSEHLHVLNEAVS